MIQDVLSNIFLKISTVDKEFTIALIFFFFVSLQNNHSDQVHS